MSVPVQQTYVAMQSLQHIDFGWHEVANGDTDADVVYSWGFWYNHYDITVEGDLNFHGGASVAGAVHQPLIDFLIKLPAGKRVRIRPGMWAFRWATRRQAWPITDATLLGRYDAAVQFGGAIDDTTAVFVPYEVVADPPLAFDIAVALTSPPSSSSGTVMATATTSGTARSANRARGTVSASASVTGRALSSSFLAFGITVALSEPAPSGVRASGTVTAVCTVAGRGRNRPRASGTVYCVATVIHGRVRPSLTRARVSVGTYRPSIRVGQYRAK